MSRSTVLIFLVLIGSLAASGKVLAADRLPQSSAAIQFAATDWPCWRGPHGNGIASPEQAPPLRWGKADNVLWKMAIPGRGHSSPIVVGDRVIVTTADEDRESQSV